MENVYHVNFRLIVFFYSQINNFMASRAKYKSYTPVYNCKYLKVDIIP